MLSTYASRPWSSFSCFCHVDWCHNNDLFFSVVWTSTVSLSSETSEEKFLLVSFQKCKQDLNSLLIHPVSARGCYIMWKNVGSSSFIPSEEAVKNLINSAIFFYNILRRLSLELSQTVSVGSVLYCPLFTRRFTELVLHPDDDLRFLSRSLFVFNFAYKEKSRQLVESSMIPLTFTINLLL